MKADTTHGGWLWERYAQGTVAQECAILDQVLTHTPRGCDDCLVDTTLRLPDQKTLAHTYALEAVKGFGPQKFRELRDRGLTASEVLADPSRLPTGGKRGDTFRAEIARLASAGLEVFEQRASRQLERARQHGAHILLHGDDGYPPNLWASNNPIPVLYIRGDLGILGNRRAVACVGSRKIRDEYEERQRGFATFASHAGFVVVSGFALGADSVAHRAARDAGGATVCVMPCGLDRPFPPENRTLWAEFDSYQGAVQLSEFPFGTAAATLTLRKRNKTIVGLALGALVGQSSSKGGAMNAFRFATEQRKPVATFSPDGAEDTGGNRMIVESDGTEFPADRPSEQAWEAWLQTLSSSI